MRKFTYLGRVDDAGKLEINRERFVKELVEYANKEIVLTIEKKTNGRTARQNRYLFGVVYPLLLHGLIDLGYDLNDGDIELVHEFAKHRFLGKVKIGKKNIETPDGEVITLPPSTTRLTTEQFSQYWERIAQFAAEYLSVTVPPPQNEADFPDEPR